MSPRRLEPAEVAERLGLPSEDAVWREARLGRLPHVKLGRRILFFEDAIEAFRLGSVVPITTESTT
jgi:hypothetical protein